MLTDFAAISHPGLTRANNEDAYLLSVLDGDEPILNGPCRPLAPGPAGLLVAVADGMGGAAAGEVASREGLAALALVLYTLWAEPGQGARPEALPAALEEAVRKASDAVLRYTRDERSARGMGSTLTAAVLRDGWAQVAQIGDSRAYLWRRGRLLQITEDQTLVHELVAQGALTESQARVHPHRNVITQALGSAQPLRVIQTRVLLEPGDRLLLCSDGLHGELSDALLADVLAQDAPAGKVLEDLLEEALDAGGRDNITALLLAFGPVGRPADQEGPAARAGALGWISRVFGGQGS